MEKGYLFILVNLPERVGELDVANVPQETLFTPRTSINDIQEDKAGNTKTSENAGDDRANEDSLHHVLLPPFMMDWKMAFNKMPQRREPLARLL